MKNCRRVSGNNPNVGVQLDVFDEQRECDEAQSLQGPNGINLNSHLDVFYTILGQVRIILQCNIFIKNQTGFSIDFLSLPFIGWNILFCQVADTPQEIPFLSILQHLLRIDPKEAISDIIWDCAETLVHRATLLENREDSTRLLRTPSVQKFTCSHCRTDISSPNRKQSIPAPLTPTQLIPLSPTASIVTEPIIDSSSKVPKPPPPPPPMA